MKPGMLPEYAIGVDVGGTKINIGIVSNTGQIIKEHSIPTRAAERPITESIIDGIQSLLQNSGHSMASLKGIGVGSAGQIDFRTGKVHFATSILPGYTGTPVKALLEEAFHTNVYVDNDVNALALAEKNWGVGKNYGHFLCLALGTGVGGAIVSEGRLLRGAVGAAGELGHVPVNIDGPLCTCGNYGCLEIYASGTGIERMLQEQMNQASRNSEGGDTIINARQATQLWLQGHHLAIVVFDRMLKALSSALAGFIHTFNPQAIIIGGGVAEIGAPLFTRLREETAAKTMASMYEGVKLLPAYMGNKSSMIGAASQIWEYGIS